MLKRTTWYNHNPGGKKAKHAEFSQEEIRSISNLPVPRRPIQPRAKGKKRRLDEEDAEIEDTPHIPKRVVGPSSVCEMSVPAYMHLKNTIFMIPST